MLAGLLTDPSSLAAKHRSTIVDLVTPRFQPIESQDDQTFGLALLNGQQQKAVDR